MIYNIVLISALLESGLVICIYYFSQFFPLWFITGYWIEFSVLYSRKKFILLKDSFVLPALLSSFIEILWTIWIVYQGVQFDVLVMCILWGASQVVPVVKNLPANAGDVGDAGSIPGSGRWPGGGDGTPLQCSCLENPMDRGAWRATAHGVARIRHDWACTHVQQTPRRGLVT